MQALVFHKPSDVRVEGVPDPVLEAPTDAILRVTSTAICGSDLHIYNGLFPQPKPLILGHEFMGVVEEVGSEVKKLKRGDRVVVPFPIACGSCFFCQKDLPVACERSNPDHYGPEGGILKGKGGGLFGYTDLYGGYDGGQAELVRVPYADVGPRKVPDGLSDDQVLFLTDILPTGWTAIDWADLQALGQVLDKGLRLRAGQAPVHKYIDELLRLVEGGRIRLDVIITHRLPLAHAPHGYEVFNKKLEDCVKVVLSP